MIDHTVQIDQASDTQAVWPLHILFDGPPSHESGRFVEVNDHTGKSVRAGEWIEADEFWELVIQRPSSPLADTFDDILRTAHRENLALRLFLGCCEGWLQSRDTFGDAGLVDMIAIAAQKAAAALEDIKKGDGR